MRMIVTGWAYAVDAAWAKVADDYELSFDWDFVPAWIDAHIDWSEPGNPVVIPRKAHDVRGDPKGKAQSGFISSDDVDVHSIASLIQKVCKSALPFGFQWAEAYEHDDYSTAFGGGYYVISDAEIFGGFRDAKEVP